MGVEAMRSSAANGASALLPSCREFDNSQTPWEGSSAKVEGIGIDWTGTWLARSADCVATMAFCVAINLAIFLCKSFNCLCMASLWAFSSELIRKASAICLSFASSWSWISIFLAVFLAFYSILKSCHLV